MELREGVPITQLVESNKNMIEEVSSILDHMVRADPFGVSPEDLYIIQKIYMTTKDKSLLEIFHRLCVYNREVFYTAAETYIISHCKNCKSWVAGMSAKGCPEFTKCVNEIAVNELMSVAGMHNYEELFNLIHVLNKLDYQYHLTSKEMETLNRVIPDFENDLGRLFNIDNGSVWALNEATDGDFDVICNTSQIKILPCLIKGNCYMQGDKTLVVAETTGFVNYMHMDFLTGEAILFDDDGDVISAYSMLPGGDKISSERIDEIKLLKDMAMSAIEKENSESEDN
ncbi:MAG: hypothetical protein ACRC0V_10785 [Fusobacteriaceae bacterium]